MNMSRTHMQRLVILTSAALLAVMSAAAFAQEDTDASKDESLAPAAAMRALLSQLAREGTQARDEAEMPRSFPNIAAEFPHEVPMEVLARKITARLDRDPFVDMYMRWQLTSFSPDLPDMTDREFERMVDNLSEYVPNPRADAAFINQVNRGLDAGELSERDQEAFEQRFNSLASDSSKARALSQPAEQFRQWLAGQVGETGMRAIQLQIDHVLALTHAGWPVGAQKRGLEAMLGASRRDRSFDDAQRRRIARQVSRLREDTRNFVASARIVEARIEVNFALTGIYDFDIRRWIRALER